MHLYVLLDNLNGIDYLKNAENVGSPKKSSVILPSGKKPCYFSKIHLQMEVNNSNNEFEHADRIFWEEPDNYALVKKYRDDGVLYYNIFMVKPRVMMKLCDDFGYSLKLANKMIDNGVRIFEGFPEFNQWYKQINSKD
jgi:hypothetical protein